MQIHELDLFTGSISDTTLLAIDDGTETMKVPATALGIRTEMTLAEAEAGTGTEPRVITPKVLYDFTGVDGTVKGIYDAMGWIPD